MIIMQRFPVKYDQAHKKLQKLQQISILLHNEINEKPQYTKCV